MKELEAVRMRVNDWKLSGGGWRAIEEGLVLSYKRGREAFARARRGGSMEDLHEWRKRVKDLWHHQRLLAPVGGPGVQGEAKDAHRLSDLLGDDHDLALLRQELTRGKMAVPVDLDAVVELIDHQRTELQREAIAIGERVYADSPKAFRRRMRRTWNGGRALARAPYETEPAALAAATRQPQPD
ncbi:MAG: CHAD domain-containing protein [Solirubrobacterales bacterium]|nr:CHAD domain-containing protein [Solirubrobacterales bacterium]